VYPRFNIGDEVKVIDENLIGRIVKIDKTKITILNEFNFEESYDINEIILNKKLNDFDLQNEIILSKNQPIDTINIKTKHPNISILEVDLHIGHLADNLNKLTKHKMLQIQLKKIRETLNIAREQKLKTVIFIHGKGKGVLKDELYKILDSENKIDYFDASFQKYKFGATEVKFL
jgi:dsDNA-specific endonuclease/ATPase MutS2